MAIDPQKIEHQLQVMLASIEPYTQGDEPNNVLARIQFTVIPAIIRWKVGEMNRGTDEDSVLNALVCLVASQTVDIVGEVIGSAVPSDRHFALSNKILQAIGEELGAILSGSRDMNNFNIMAETSH